MVIRSAPFLSRRLAYCPWVHQQRGLHALVAGADFALHMQPRCPHSEAARHLCSAIYFSLMIITNDNRLRLVKKMHLLLEAAALQTVARLF